jgi:hypothetical protein
MWLSGPAASVRLTGQRGRPQHLTAVMSVRKILAACDGVCSASPAIRRRRSSAEWTDRTSSASMVSAEATLDANPELVHRGIEQLDVSKIRMSYANGRV